MKKLTQEQIERVVSVECRDPFEFLGMHFIDEEKKKGVVVRMFYPELENVYLVESDSKKTHRMKSIDSNGIYELQFNDEIEFFPYKYRVLNKAGESWEIDDPYRFWPVLGEQDIYFLNEGTHMKAYEKLGAHLIEHQGSKGVHFVVWAPNAKRVSVIGDFNRWDGRIHPMRVLNGGFWEIFIPNINEGEIYKFEIKAQNDALLYKLDPYASYSELAPQTVSIVYNIDNYDWNDSEWMKIRKERNSLNAPVSIYELHIGSWKRDWKNEYLNYRDLAHELVPYIKNMGYTHIELLPIMEHPFYGSWGYQVTGYFSPTKRYGEPRDFMYFVDYCHQNGIGVILDWVPAHFPKDDYALAHFDGTALYEHEDPRKGEHQDWGTLIFNYGRYEVRNFLITNAIFWLDKYHIDGLRVDAVASMLYLDYSRKDGEWVPNKYGGRENLEAIEFLKMFNEKVYELFPDTMTIAEESTAWPAVSRPLYTGGLGFGFKWNMGWMHDILDYFAKDPVFRTYHHNALTFSLWYAFHENFVLSISHDEVVHGKGSMINKMSGDLWQKFANLRLFYLYMYTHPGKKLTFMGMDIGQWREWNHDSGLDWHLLQEEKHEKLNYFVKDLNSLYTTKEVLFKNDFSSDGFEWIDFQDSQQSIISYIRRWESKFIVCVLNFTPVVRQNYRIGVPDEGVYKIAFNTDSEYYGGSNVGDAIELATEKIEWQKKLYSIKISLPPLAGVVIEKIR